MTPTTQIALSELLSLYDRADERTQRVIFDRVKELISGSAPWRLSKKSLHDFVERIAMNEGARPRLPE